MEKKTIRLYHAIGTAVLLTAAFLFTLIILPADMGFAQGTDDKSIECQKEIAKTIVHGTALGLGEVLRDVKGEKKRIALIRKYISPVRFYADNTGYFYVYKYNCVNIAHATQKELQGKNLYKHKDAKGKYVIRELSDAAKTGGGFVDFYWLKPGAKGEQKKVGYVEPIPGTDYFIGTGVYLP
jgi:hypothetical protein